MMFIEVPNGIMMDRWTPEGALERIFGSAELKALVDDFNRNFPEVTRTWDKLVLAEERDA